MLREKGTPALKEWTSEEELIKGPEDEWGGLREEGMSWEPREEHGNHEGGGGVNRVSGRGLTVTTGCVHLEASHQWPWRWDSVECRGWKSEHSSSGSELVSKGRHAVWTYYVPQYSLMYAFLQFY